MSDHDELIERATWVLKQHKILRQMGEFIRVVGPAACADLLKLRDLTGEMIDVARHLAEDPRVSSKVSGRIRRIAERLNRVYAGLGEVYEELGALKQDETDPEC
jgi:hypothetical protein